MLNTVFVRFWAQFEGLVCSKITVLYELKIGYIYGAEPLYVLKTVKPADFLHIYPK